MLYKLD